MTAQEAPQADTPIESKAASLCAALCVFAFPASLYLLAWVIYQ